MVKTVYFVRHGECVANVNGVIAGGGDDSPLTELGKIQAKETAQNLKDIQFDFVVSSPMSRAYDTAVIITEELHIAADSIMKKAEFTERNVGEFTGKPKEEYFAFEAAGGEAGETTSEMQERVREGLNWLGEQEFHNALVATHNGTVRMIQTVLEDLPAKEFARFPQLHNGEYLKVDF
jgi:broad specificity phosphatase PhoE